MPLPLSTPEPASVPGSSVSGIDVVVYQGPPARSTDCPEGAVASATIARESLPWRPAPFVASTLTLEGLAAPAVHE